MSARAPGAGRAVPGEPAVPALLRMGWTFVRTTSGLGWRLLQRQAPLALAAGPLGRGVSRASSAVLRSQGRDLDPAELPRTHPHATGRVLVLVPDSADGEESWSTGHDAYGGSYPSRLSALLGWTPVHVRATPASADPGAAADLSALLQRVVDHWPVPVERIALLGAGDGGLALRAATAVTTLEGRPWQELVDHVVLLGTPHLVAEPASGGLPLGRDADEELAGIVASDRARVDLAPLAHATYTVITRRARLEHNLLGSLLGNLVWWRDRARLRRRRAHELFPTAAVVHVDDAGAPLLNHPEVQRALLDWLA